MLALWVIAIELSRDVWPRHAGLPHSYTSPAALELSLSVLRMSLLHPSTTELTLQYSLRVLQPH